MIKNYEEVPETIEGLRFYIFAAEKSLRDLKLRTANQEKLLAIAKERFQLKLDSPKKESMEEEL